MPLVKAHAGANQNECDIDGLWTIDRGIIYDVVSGQAGVLPWLNLVRMSLFLQYQCETW
jgi:hypothetical protein